MKKQFLEEGKDLAELPTTKTVKVIKKVKKEPVVEEKVEEKVEIGQYGPLIGWMQENIEIDLAIYDDNLWVAEHDQAATQFFSDNNLT